MVHSCSDCKLHIYNEDLPYFLSASLCAKCYKVKGYSNRWCIDCEENIPNERITIMPNVKRCLSCQSELEEFENFKNKRKPF